jgi:hypothetical protein
MRAVFFSFLLCIVSSSSNAQLNDGTVAIAPEVITNGTGSNVARHLLPGHGHIPP